MNDLPKFNRPAGTKTVHFFMKISPRVFVGLFCVGLFIWLRPLDSSLCVGAQVERPKARPPIPKTPPTARKKPSDTTSGRSSGSAASLSIPSATWPQFVTVTLDARGKLISSPIKTADFITEDLGNGVTLDLVKIPAGSFVMGSPSRERESQNTERPQHRVSVSEFLMGRFEVTREQWRQVAVLPRVKIELITDPARFQDSWQQPVESVSWEEAVEFCARLQKKTGETYRLPTEAEWEYAARAGTTTPFAFGETIAPRIVNYSGHYYNSRDPFPMAPKRAYRQKTVPVGSLGVANAFGLFDMHGNVQEWCEDDQHINYDGAPTDGSAWKPADISARDSKRVIRGCGWDAGAIYCRSATRGWYTPGYRYAFLGFRLARTLR